MNMMGNVGGFLSPIVCRCIVQSADNCRLVFNVTAAMYGLGIFFRLAIGPVTHWSNEKRISKHDRISDARIIKLDDMRCSARLLL